jgi:hypothetical protein
MVVQNSQTITIQVTAMSAGIAIIDVYGLNWRERNLEIFMSIFFDLRLCGYPKGRTTANLCRLGRRITG